MSVKTYHNILLNHFGEEYLWEQSSSIPFDELIISWSALRPSKGDFLIYASVKTDHWSPWYLYSSWGNSGQHGGDVEDLKIPLKINQDILEILEGRQASGFRIRVKAVAGANLQDLKALHASASRSNDLHAEELNQTLSSIQLDVPLISQINLPHPRCMHLCSPASTASAVSYLLKKELSPVEFSLKVRDDKFDIFGNWVLNTANAASVLGPSWHCWVQRLQGFQGIYDQLKLKIPVVVSVKGPLPGSALPYKEGHLMVVKGYDSKLNLVSCMDPAFPSDAETNVNYQRKDFMAAWSRRRYVAYCFKKVICESKVFQNPEL